MPAPHASLGERRRDRAGAAAVSLVEGLHRRLCALRPRGRNFRLCPRHPPLGTRMPGPARRGLNGRPQPDLERVSGIGPVRHRASVRGPASGQSGRRHRHRRRHQLLPASDARRGVQDRQAEGLQLQRLRRVLPRHPGQCARPSSRCRDRHRSMPVAGPMSSSSIRARRRCWLPATSSPRAWRTCCSR